MLYTGKGDDGTTKLFDCPPGKRISKTDFAFEALGSLDELNSTLGYTKVLSKVSGKTLTIGKQKIPYEKIIETIQQSLFCVQAEVGGSDMRATESQILYLERIVREAEAMLPPIKSFVIPGESAASAYLDIARTIARRAERKILSLREKKERDISPESLVFMNRLSSALYALARLANWQEGNPEKEPEYPNQLSSMYG